MRIIQNICFVYILGILFACNDPSLNSSGKKENSKEQENNPAPVVPSQDSDLVNEDVIPPNNIMGSYLVSCEASLADAAIPNKIKLTCQIQREDHSLAQTQGDWSGQILNPLPGEKLALMDNKQGLFEVEAAEANTLASTLSRTNIRFNGNVDGTSQDLTSMADKTLEVSGSKIPTETPATAPAPTPLVQCPAGYILVPADSSYGTSTFCAMKYEAKNVNDTATSQAALSPWVSISQTEARTRCQALGAKYDLISNEEWLAISTNISKVGNNWSTGMVGFGSMNVGHSDNNPSMPCPASTDDSQAYVDINCSGMSLGMFTQRRTHQLSNGEIIWDIAGNTWDWTSYAIPANNAKPFSSLDGAPADNWREFPMIDSGFTSMPRNRLRPMAADQSFWNDSWNSTFGIGQYYAGNNGSGGALQRGGSWDDFLRSGVFAAGLFLAPNGTFNYTGFRCVYRP
jgi:hypothetical protein